MPRLSEKKACPMAASSTPPSTFSKSGFSKNSMPRPEPGNSSAQTARMSSRMKRAGIMILDERSMPFSTPFTIMKWVMSKNKTVHTTGSQGLLTNVSNRVMKSAGVLSAKWPTPADTMYCSVHPATTE